MASKAVLILGSGGREHALAWKLAQNPHNKVFLEPGNPGTERAGLSRLPATSLTEQVAKAREAKIDLVVIGPEVLLDAGYADAFRKEGFAVVGPNREGARLETSKVFSKEFMLRAHLPTAPFTVVESESALLRLGDERSTWPIVAKLDGLAAGKGVVIAKELSDLEDFARRIWHEKEFGQGPHRVLVEEFIEGQELSYIGMCDGRRFIPLATSTDFKRIGDGNTGANTGGMGCMSPSPFFNSELEKKITERIITPFLRQLEKEKLEYRGALYVGVMIDKQGNPHVLEFNARFGDPETQAMLLRLESDFYALLEATANGRLEQLPPQQWSSRAAVYVVATASGYPGKVTTGDAISGPSEVAPDVQVFFSGVKLSGEQLVTGGGRVLGLGTLGQTIADARQKIYQEIRKVYWKGIYYRSDIGVTERG